MRYTVIYFAVGGVTMVPKTIFMYLEVWQNLHLYFTENVRYQSALKASKPTRTVVRLMGKT